MRMDLLQNENIRLRALEPEDLELLYHWENNPEWWELGQLRLMIDFLPMNATIGMIDLYDFEPHHHRAGIGILIDPLYQKKGLATEALVLLEKYAFSFLKLHQLYVHIPTKNESSKALFACCGYTITGILTDWIVAEDGYSDVLTMQKIYRNIPTEI